MLGLFKLTFASFVFDFTSEEVLCEVVCHFGLTDNKVSTYLQVHQNGARDTP